MGKKERRHERARRAKTMAKIDKLSIDPNMPLEDFLSMAGVLPPALIMDTWGNAIEDPDVLDRCRETLMRHILDKPLWTFATLGHTQEFKNLIQRINEVLEVINQNMLLAKPEDTIDTSRMLQLESRPFTMEDVNLTFTLSSTDYPGDEPGIDNEEGGYRPIDIYLDPIWAAPVKNNREDFVEGFGRFLPMVSHPIRPEPWLSRVIDGFTVVDMVVNRRSEMLKDMGIKNRIPYDFSNSLKDGMRNNNNGVTVQPFGWNDNFSCVVGSAAVRWRFSADGWKNLAWNPPIPGSRYKFRDQGKLGNLRRLAETGQLPSENVKDRKYSNNSVLHHWGIPGMREFYKSKESEILRSAMADLLNGDEKAVKQLIQPMIDSWFLTRPGLVFTPDGSELDSAGIGYASMLEKMLPPNHKYPLVVMDAGRTKNYQIPRLEWWGLTEVYRGQESWDRTKQYSYKQPIANSLELEEDVLEIIQNMCPFWESFSETVVRSAWLKQDMVPKLAGRLDLISDILPVEDVRGRKEFRDAVMKPLNSWRYSTGDMREETQSIGTILFDMTSKNVVGIEFYEVSKDRIATDI